MTGRYPGRCTPSLQGDSAYSASHVCSQWRCAATPRPGWAERDCPGSAERNCLGSAASARADIGARYNMPPRGRSRSGRPRAGAERQGGEARAQGGEEGEEGQQGRLGVVEYSPVCSPGRRIDAARRKHVWTAARERRDPARLGPAPMWRRGSPPEIERPAGMAPRRGGPDRPDRTTRRRTRVQRRLVRPFRPAEGGRMRAGTGGVSAAGGLERERFRPVGTRAGPRRRARVDLAAAHAREPRALRVRSRPRSDTLRAGRLPGL